MPLEELKCSNFRIFESLEYHPKPGLNVITGANGAGKTSILEAIYLLSVGRSFKTFQNQPIIRHGERTATVFGINRVKDVIHRIGIKKEGGNKDDIRLDGKSITRLSDIARLQPVQVLTPGSSKILELEAANRRRFVEWGLFHVEPSYLNELSRFRKSLAQRNSILRSGRTPGSEWDKLVQEKGEVVNRFRQKYVDSLTPYYHEELDSLKIRIKPELKWYKGWKNDLSLEEQFVHDRATDLKLGYTHSGPQRADLKVLEYGLSSSKILSRGQQKLVLLALKTAQGRLLQSSTGKDAIYLLDDLLAELDKNNRDIVLNRLNELATQIFITASDGDVFQRTLCSMFHVEH